MRQFSGNLEDKRASMRVAKMLETVVSDVLI